MSRKQLFQMDKSIMEPDIPLSVAYRRMQVWQRSCVKLSGQRNRILGLHKHREVNVLPASVNAGTVQG